MTLYCLDLLTFSLPRANVSLVSFVFWYSQELSVHEFLAFYGIVVTFETLYLIPTCGSCLAIIVWCSSGERATAESVAEAIAENRAELVHLPSAIDLSVALPSKECPNCDGSVSHILLGHLSLVAIYYFHGCYVSCCMVFLSWCLVFML